MIHKWLKEGMNKSQIARRLGISRETVRKYALKPEGHIPIITRTPNENLVDEYLPYIATMLETAKANKVEIPTTVIYDEIVKLGYTGTLRWLQRVMQRYELRKRAKDEEKLVRFVLVTLFLRDFAFGYMKQIQVSKCKLIGPYFQNIIYQHLLRQWGIVELHLYNMFKMKN